MQYRQIGDQPKTFALILNTGDEIVKTLSDFAASQHLSGSSFKAIGALSHVRLGWFDWENKKYETAAELHEQVELLSLIGDIALHENMPQVHAHLTIGRRDGQAYGGHLLEAHVRPTCELILTESPEELRKQVDADSRLALIRL